jgi:hypothetical protein
MYVVTRLFFHFSVSRNAFFFELLELYANACRHEQQAAERRALLAGATGRENVDRSAVALGQIRQGRRGVEEMLDQATHVLTGIGATREALKVCLEPLSCRFHTCFQIHPSPRVQRFPCVWRGVCRF